MSHNLAVTNVLVKPTVVHDLLNTPYLQEISYSIRQIELSYNTQPDLTVDFMS
jgi:hypothetical protein